MKMWKKLLAVTVLGALLLSGCGKNYDTDKSTVFVTKSGEIVSTDVETFDEATYDKTDLESFINQEIEAYTMANGADLVVLNKLEVEEGNAVLTIEYKSAKDYTKFTGIELFTGTLIEALSQGFSFDVDFAAIEDGKARACDGKEILGGGDYKVVIIKGNVQVKVPGTIVYASVENATLVDKNTIAIAEGTSLLGTSGLAADDTQGTEDKTEDTTETDTQAGAVIDEGSVDDEEFWSVETASTEVTFEFDDEQYKKPENKNEFSQVTNYIIYK